MIALLVILHVTIALGSIGFATYGSFRPSLAKIRLAYGLVALTLISGSVLVIFTHQPILNSCLTGLAYLAIVMSGVVGARVRLAKLDKTD